MSERLFLILQNLNQDKSINSLLDGFQIETSEDQPLLLARIGVLAEESLYMAPEILAIYKKNLFDLLRVPGLLDPKTLPNDTSVTGEAREHYHAVLVAMARQGWQNELFTKVLTAYKEFCSLHKSYDPDYGSILLATVGDNTKKIPEKGRAAIASELIEDKTIFRDLTETFILQIPDLHTPTTPLTRASKAAAEAGEAEILKVIFSHPKAVESMKGKAGDDFAKGLILALNNPATKEVALKGFAPHPPKDAAIIPNAKKISQAPKK